MYAKPEIKQIENHSFSKQQILGFRGTLDAVPEILWQGVRN